MQKTVIKNKKLSSYNIATKKYNIEVVTTNHDKVWGIRAISSAWELIYLKEINGLLMSAKEIEKHYFMNNNKKSEINSCKSSEIIKFIWIIFL